MKNKIIICAILLLSLMLIFQSKFIETNYLYVPLKCFQQECHSIQSIQINCNSNNCSTNFYYENEIFVVAKITKRFNGDLKIWDHLSKIDCFKWDVNIASKYPPNSIPKNKTPNSDNECSTANRMNI